MFGYDQTSINMGGQLFSIKNNTGRLSWSAPVTSAGNTIAMKAFSYDPMGRVSQLWAHPPSDPAGTNIVFSYNYDFLGNETAYFVGNNPPGSTEFVSTYNAAGRLTSHTTPTWNDATNPANLLTSVHYDAFGHVIAANFANGLSQSWKYDPRERLQATAVGTTGSCSNGSCSNPVYSLSLGYFNNSDVKSASDLVNGNWTYTYDDFNRVLTSTCSSNCPGSYRYAYDRYGNRWQQTLTAGSGFNSSFTFSGANNRIDGYSYDAAGNLFNDGSHNYAYDAENRISSVDGGATSYIYDADGQRVEKNQGGVLTDTVYDRNGHPRLRTNFGSQEIYAAGLHLGTYVLNSGHTDTIFYYDHSDWLGTERARVDLSGAACEKIASLPFGDGQTITGTCGDISSLHFTGKERDSETGLDNFEARYFGSSLGRFMSPDPENISAVLNSDDPQAWNGHTYGHNNPLRYTDPEGLNYTVCEVNGKNCADLTDKQYERYRKDNPDVRATLVGPVGR
jgi:RHS repeat-associated protein